jgi:hypothetical protein
MTYLTLEVEIENGRIIAKEPLRLPDTAKGLLTIFLPDAPEISELTPLQAFDALQKHLNLDADKAAAWMTAVTEARR